MFVRRNIRCSVVAAVCLLIVLLGLITIHQSRDIVFSELSSPQRSEHVSFLSQNINQVLNTRSKRSTSRSSPSDSYTADQYQNKNLVVTNSTNLPNVNLFNNNRLRQRFNPIQHISYSVIDTKNLESFVHLDLKGAAPKIGYYQKLFPFLKKLGATGLLIEYEDMFPFTDRLTVIKHGFAYTKNDIQQILQLAETNNLKVMPLLQVYGHLEYVLKLKEFMHLREDSRYPQVITPCLEDSYRLIFGM
jgi:hypothetical protein